MGSRGRALVGSATIQSAAERHFRSRILTKNNSLDSLTVNFTDLCAPEVPIMVVVVGSRRRRRRRRRAIGF